MERIEQAWFNIGNANRAVDRAVTPGHRREAAAVLRRCIAELRRAQLETLIADEVRFM
jgi:hypothetical protein